MGSAMEMPGNHKVVSTGESGKRRPLWEGEIFTKDLTFPPAPLLRSLSSLVQEEGTAVVKAMKAEISLTQNHFLQSQCEWSREKERKGHSGFPEGTQLAWREGTLLGKTVTSQKQYRFVHDLQTNASYSETLSDTRRRKNNKVSALICCREFDVKHNSNLISRLTSKKDFHVDIFI